MTSVTERMAEEGKPACPFCGANWWRDQSPWMQFGCGTSVSSILGQMPHQTPACQHKWSRAVELLKQFRKQAYRFDSKHYKESSNLINEALS